MEKDLSALLNSEAACLLLPKAASLPATQSTPRSTTNPTNTLHPSPCCNSNTSPLHLQQSLSAEIPVSSLKCFPVPQHRYFLIHLQVYLPHKYR